MTDAEENDRHGYAQPTLAQYDALRAELAVLRAQRDAALELCQAARVARSAPNWNPKRGAIADFALGVEAALGVQPEPSGE
jgi:hypothetical protein